MDSLEECPIQALRNAILSRGVMNGELMFSSCSLQMCLEHIAQIFPTSVHMQLADACVHLHPAPGLIFLVGHEDLIFLMKEVEVSESSAVIHEGHIVSMLMQHLDRGRSPYI